MVAPAIEPPPPGVIPNYKNPQSTGYELIVAGAVTVAFALVAVIARLASKSIAKQSLGWDDSFSVLAICLAIGRFACSCMMVSYGTGRHIWDEPISRAVKTVPYALASNALYLWAIMFAKCSILALYLRVFGINGTFRRVCWVLGGMIVFYCVACTPLLILECTPGPVRSFAQVENNQCVSVLGINVAAGAMNIATDTALLLLPIPMIKKLQMPKKRKVAVLIVFGTGLVAWTASVVREIVFVHSVSNTDATRTQVTDHMILSIELNVAILAGCLPVLLPLIQRISKVEGLRYYLSSMASESKILRKKFSRARMQSPTKSEPRESESLSEMKTPSGGRPSDEEKMIASTIGKEPWFMQEQPTVDTRRALNEGY